MKKFKISKFFNKYIYINQTFQFHEKIQDFQNFQKKIKKEKKFQNFQFLRKIQVFQIKKKKKKSSLNSSLGTESYDPFLYSPMMQHQVNCPPLAFIEACNMSQTRGIRQVCQSRFNE